MQTNDADALSAPRAAVARAIAALRGFEGSAGTPEMRAVMASLDWLGLAYCCLDKPAENPAWSDLD